VIHLLADHGWLDYQSTLNSSVRLVREKPEVIQRFVNASISGWHDYLHGDPTPGDLLIQRDNPDMLGERIASSRNLMLQAGLLESGDASTLGMGAMTDARWQAFYNSMVVAGAQPAGLDIRKAYTTQFVNQGVGLT
jgi:NitT/TauT family transport system substrate-binding protein